ncbi:MAG: MinD/ParA family protein [Oscillospiraceae bacterium]|jgi:flagellar biosynthesis protein FlhG|nr:MinD/ParA family protein [Oscillospiraceae bacterium]
MSDQASNLRELMGKSRDVRVISVASGKGGVGKSSISVNLAITMSRLGARVLILDADFGLANIDVMLGITTRLDLSYFLKGERTLHEIIQLGHEGVRFISGGSGVNELINMSENQLAELLTKIVHIDEPIDIIIMDAGAGVSNTIMQVLLASSETIVVTTAEPTSVLDAYALVKTIVKRDASHPLHVLVNKCENNKEAQSVQTGFVNVSGKNLGKNINPLGLISYNRDFTSAIKRQIPITVSDPYCATAKEINTIARAVLDIPNEKASSSVLSRVFSRMLGTDRGLA